MPQKIKNPLKLQKILQHGELETLNLFSILESIVQDNPIIDAIRDVFVLFLLLLLYLLPNPSHE